LTGLRYLLLGAWAIWLGSIVFFSFVVAPTAFAALGRERAVPLMRAIFPRYYAVGIGCGLTGIAAALACGSGLHLTIPLAIAVVLAAYARQVLTPALEEARRSADDESFARLHLWSVRLNVVALALLLLAGTVLLEG